MTSEAGRPLMKALNVAVLVVGLLGGLAGLGSLLVVTSERISTKDEVLAVKEEALAMDTSLRRGGHSRKASIRRNISAKATEPNGIRAASSEYWSSSRR